MKTNKKGVSLAFVIVVVLALVIFSSLLFSAAARSLSMTGESTEGREAYLRAKSAIEYAKTEVYSMAKSNRLAAFSVGPDGDSFRQIADRAADGTACLAECKPGSDGKTWTVTAKVKYRNSAQFRLLSYSFAFQNNPSVNGFIASGGSIGGSSYLNPGGEAANQPVYPILVQVPVYSTQGFTAPEMYFTDGYKLKGGGSSTENLTSNLVYLRGRINSDPGGQNATVSLHLCGIKDKDASSIQQKKGYAGIVWFHGASFQPRNSSAFASIPDGAYYFRKGADLFSKATLANLFDRNTLNRLFPNTDDVSADGKLQPVPQEDLQPSSGLTLGGKSLAGYAASVAYITDNAGRVKDGTSGDVNWMDQTKFKTSYGNNCGVFDAGDADVSIYTDGGYKDNWQNCTSPLSYCARRIQLLKVDSSSLTFQIPNIWVTFQTGSFWFCEQSSQTYPWVAPPAGLPTDAPTAVQRSRVPTGVPIITAASDKSHLILKSADGSDVTLIFPRGLDIQPYNSDTTLLLPAGTYTLTSGTDLFGLLTDWTTSLKPVSVGAHGADAGPGGFTITPGKYSAP